MREQGQEHFRRSKRRGYSGEARAITLMQELELEIAGTVFQAKAATKKLGNCAESKLALAGATRVGARAGVVRNKIRIKRKHSFKYSRSQNSFTRKARMSVSLCSLSAFT